MLKRAMADTIPTDEPKRPRQGEILIFCQHCGSRCTAGKSMPRVTHYYCSNPDCENNKAQKVPRPKPVDPRGIAG